MSKRARSARLKNDPGPRAKGYPPMPGPPERPGRRGCTIRDPIRCARSVAGSIATARFILAEYGPDQSIGTESVAHRAAVSPGHGFQVRPGTPGRASAGGAARTVRITRNTARIGRVVTRTRRLRRGRKD